MASAKLLSAFVALAGVVLSADAQSAAPERCPACTRMLAPVCGVDEDQEAKTFSSSCMLRWCNCLLRNADADRSFKQVKTGYCEGDPSNETEIPECFPEMETTSESPDDGDGPTFRTVNSTKEVPAAPTSRTTPKTMVQVTATHPPTTTTEAPRTLNATKEVPAAPTTRTTPKTMVQMTAIPPPTTTTEAPRPLNATGGMSAAGAALAPGALLAVAAAAAALLAAGDL